MATVNSNKDKKWSLVNPPPAGHKDVGDWAWNLFEIARDERDRLELPERWLYGYTLYRGDHWQSPGVKKNKNKLSVNLFFANVERTKANITARNPEAEVIDLEGGDQETTDMLTAHLRKWWKNTHQKRKLGTSVQKMEKYGITVEKVYYDIPRRQGDVAVLDPYAFFPAPGNWEDISTDPPYICVAYPDAVEVTEKMFNVTGVEADDVYSLLGEEREEKRPTPAGSTSSSTVQYQGSVNDVDQVAGTGAGIKQPRCLVVEIWLWDYATETIDIEIESIDEETNDVVITTEKQSQLKYPGGIRVITLTGTGKRKGEDGVKSPVVLDDKPNPNINPKLPRELTQHSYLNDHFPFYKANSYEDTTNIWGFSASEQVGDLNLRIDDVLSKLSAWVNRAMFPPLIIPKNIGITRDMINNKPNLVLMPTSLQGSQFIRFEAVPNLPPNFFQILDVLLRFFDRVYQIEDADRGVGPKGVTAASAIVALQERNAALIQHKIEMVDHLVEQRGKCEISLEQNFGTRVESVEVQGETKQFIPTDLVGMKFNYVVESGSTMPKTSLQVEAQSEKFYQLGAIDRQALLENTNYPGWKQIIERVGEGQLDQALQILIAAGLPEENAMELKQMLLEPQGGPGNREQEGVAGQRKVSSGTPRGTQGKMPPMSVVRGENE